MAGRQFLASIQPMDSFDYLAVRIKGHEAAKLGKILMTFQIKGSTSHTVVLSNGALSADEGLIEAFGEPQATLTFAKTTLAALAIGSSTFEQLSDKIEIKGNVDIVKRLLGCLEDFPSNFNVIEPLES